MNPKRPLLTVTDVAEYLSVSKITIYRLVTSGELQAKAIGGSLRFAPEVIDRYVAAADHDPREKLKSGPRRKRKGKKATKKPSRP